MSLQSHELSLVAENAGLRAEITALRQRLSGSEEIVRAIREGEIDAFVVSQPQGERIYSLRTADVLHHAMLEEMNEGCVVLDASAVVVYCNPHFARLVGAERVNIVGRSVFPFIQPEHRGAMESLCEERMHGTRMELGLLAQTGERVPTSASLNRIRLEECDVFGIILSDLRDQLRRQELVAESERKDEFLGMLAHELRNPLAPIRNAINVMDDPELSKESFVWARQVVHRQVQQLVRLLDDLLDVQRFTHGVISLKTEPVEIGALMAAVLDSVRSITEAKLQRLHIEGADEPLWIDADEARITQVISNLLLNASKYSPTHSGVWVSWARAKERARIQIVDNGVGMDAELVPRVFDAFVQGDRDLSRSQGGLGVGLTLVKRLVELHGGSVSASSEGLGEGSKFIVHLPLSKVAPPLSAAAQVPEARASSRPSRAVLVVDDNEDSAVSLCALLRMSGHQAELASDGPAALRCAEVLFPGIVILDIGLPGMDGYEVANRLRELAGTRTCHIIALTGYGRSEDRDRTEAAGFCAHVVKPVEINPLLELIEQVCSETAVTMRR
jgi:PAS domain S-box-containing protein